MEPSSVRTDPASDNQPSLPPKGGRNSQNLVYLLLICLGVGLTLFGAFARASHGESWLPEVAIALGVAVAAPGVLSATYRRFMLDEIKTEMSRPAQEFKEEAVRMLRDAIDGAVRGYQAEVKLLRELREAGVLGIYATRAEAIAALLPYVEAEAHEVTLVGSSLRGLLDGHERACQDLCEALTRKIKSGVTVRVLLTHPRVADLRARQEGREFTAIGAEIVRSIGILRERWKLAPDFVHLYMGTPTCFAIKTSTAMLLNPYPYMKEALASPCLIVERGGSMYQEFDQGHFRAWVTAIAERVPQDLETLTAALPSYASSIEELLRAEVAAGHIKSKASAPERAAAGHGPPAD